jgi:hypothetical protein
MDSIEFRPAKGIIFGPYRRLLIALPVRMKSTTMIVPFLIDTACPYCFMSRNALVKFGIDDFKYVVMDAAINGTCVSVYESSGHFEDVCILGAGYLRDSASKLTCVYFRRRFSLEKNVAEENKRDVLVHT